MLSERIVCVVMREKENQNSQNLNHKHDLNKVTVCKAIVFGCLENKNKLFAVHSFGFEVHKKKLGIFLFHLNKTNTFNVINAIIVIHFSFEIPTCFFNEIVFFKQTNHAPHTKSSVDASMIMQTKSRFVAFLHSCTFLRAVFGST